ncbi:MAG: (d)CMP kinase [Puniceicoccales bacterium]|jgi:cytidylate kinase|nr:(d)CMP kinase [Puniceicoccales bacterium]
MQNFITIAVDGAAASGKTSTSLLIANRYNFLLVSTGTHYRAFALKLKQASVSSGDTGGIGNFLRSVVLGTEVDGNVSGITIGGEDFAGEDLRTREINEAVAQYSAVDSIRKSLFVYQRSQIEVAREHGFGGVIMEGRDITSVVLPDADLKFFLEASAGERSLRRKNDRESDFIGKRDKIDGGRIVCGADVFRINTGTNGLNAVAAIISEKIDKILRKENSFRL